LREKRAASVKIRPAQKGDMPGIRRLIRRFPQQLAQTNLPGLASFVVAEQAGELIGCCALQIYSKRMAELRSLAVLAEFQTRGIASQLVKRAVDRARERGIREVFAVTSQLAFFGKLGFTTFRREKIAMFLQLGASKL
jgi:amino-acid N-acetyltransferase